MSDQFSEALHAASSSLHARLNAHGDPKQWRNVCLSTRHETDHRECIRVFLIKKRHGDGVPDEWEGFPVIKEVVGQMRLCGGGLEG